MHTLLLHSTIFALFAIFIVNIGLAVGQNSAWNIKQNPFPKAKRISATVSFPSAKAKGNVTLADPYQWLQNDTDPATIKFVADQKSLTESFIKKCTSVKQIEQSVRDAFNYNDYSDMTFFEDAKVPFWFYSVTGPNEDRKTYYIATPAEMEVARKTNFAKPPGKKFLMESLLSSNNSASIVYTMVSLDHTLIAYMVVDDGADTGSWYVRRLDSPLVQAKTRPPGGEGRLPDVIPYVYQDLRWTLDSKAFFYTQYSDNGTIVAYHQLGTPVDKDITIVNPDPDPANLWYLDYSFDGKWLVVFSAANTDSKATAYATLLTGQKLSDKMKWISIVPTRDLSLFSPVGILDGNWYVVTDENAIDRKVVKVKLDWTKAKEVTNLSQLKGRLNFTDVIPNRPFRQLNLARQTDTNKALVVYVENGKYVLYIFDLRTGKQLQKILPDEKSSPHAAFFATPTNKYWTLAYRSTVSPVKIFQVHHTETGIQTKLLTAQAIKGSNPDDYDTEQMEAISKDGTKVPYFLVRHRNRPSNTSSSIWLHGYGAYGDIDNLFWDERYFSWLQAGTGRGFVWAGLRGGGDKGEEWHIAGKNRNKPKTFDDMVAIAQDLIKRKLVNKGQINLEGNSAGGLMSAVVARQAPVGTFGAVMPDVALLDYLFFYTGAIGPANVNEFGDPAIPVEFDIIESWDPIRNLSPNIQPPPTLLTLADSDDRVVPANAYKYLAQAQHDHPNSRNPLLMYVSTSSGHISSRATTTTMVSLAVHQQCFLELTIGK
ncbi:alpha/beta-hydrolase [Meira miltonrushii]|uniref:Prolyl endopeptidase n=1 Tax=Meira miltonrushii TaxID=1280837 RepID=A0A316VHT9_9BASI|nr:alpha/beta-hydrolase [Meira miltonrushii]PWN36814.1 alpha/beta-hydrolase [Meira miltonrushii]